MEEVGDIDRLIERGLQLYGSGDVEGALHAWQQVLIVDPDDVRAAAYVDYVRENYDMLVSERRPVFDDDEVPYGLAADPGDMSYEAIEVRAQAEERRQVERYIEQIDEGWFLDDEAPHAWDHAEAREGIGNVAFEATPPARPRALPLPPTAPAPAAPPIQPEPLTLELEADEPNTGERRGDVGDFADQRSAAPTAEIHAPRGFVRPRFSPSPHDDDADDRLQTRPGRGAGSSLDGAAELRTPLAREALSSLNDDFGGRLGPDERTREVPSMRVKFEETSDVHDTLHLPGGGGRFDTSAEPTMELPPNRRAPRMSAPLPLDEATGERPAHPPLVIIEDPVLSSPPDPPRTRTLDSAWNDSAPALPVRRAGTDLGLGALGSIPPQVPTRSRTSTEDLATRIDADVDRGAPPNELRGDRTRRRVAALIDRAVAASMAGDHGNAVVALDLALSEEPDSAVSQKLFARHQMAILDVYQRYLGDLSRRPALAMPMHELSNQKLDIRAAFLLSRIDGSLTFEEILDVAGMQRAEAFRHLSLLVLRGILEVR